MCRTYIRFYRSIHVLFRRPVLLALFIAGLAPTFTTPAPAAARDEAASLTRELLEDASALFRTAELERAARHPLKALNFYALAARQYERRGETVLEAVCLERIADLQLQLEQPITARGTLERVVDLRRAAGDRAGEVGGLERLAGLYLEAGDTARAASTYAALRRLFRQTGDRRGEALAWLGSGTAAWRAGDTARARHDLKRALKSLQALDLTHEAAGVYAVQAAIAREAGDYRAAYRLDAKAVAADPGEAGRVPGLLADAIALGRCEEVVRIVERHPVDGLEPLEQLEVQLIGLAAQSSMGTDEGRRQAAAALARALAGVPARELRPPRLEPVRRFLADTPEMPRVRADALRAILQVLASPRTALSDKALRSQLEVLLGSTDGAVAAR